MDGFVDVAKAINTSQQDEKQDSKFNFTKKEFKDITKPLRDNGVDWETEEIIWTLATTSITNSAQAWAFSKALLKDRELFIQIRDTVEKIGLDQSEDFMSMAVRICKDNALFKSVKSFCCNCAKKVGFETAKKVGDSPDPKQMAETLSSMKEKVLDKLGELDKSVGDEAFKNKLNQINYAYLIGSIVCLVLSWVYIIETVGTIKDANQFISDKREELKTLYEEEIKPILAFMNKIQKTKTVFPSKYKEYHQKIKYALKSLNDMKEEIAKEKKRVKTKGFNNAISAVAMATSAITSFGMGGPTWMKYLGYAQATTSVVHTGMSVACLVTFNKLNDFNREIQSEINKLRQVQKKLNQYYENYKNEKNITKDDEAKIDINDPNNWDTEQVVEWTKKQNKKFTEIAQIFDDNGVDGADLLELDDQTLQSIGVKNQFQRKQLLRKIKALR